MQLSIFEPETLSGMSCRKPTPKYPNGRTGTNTGYVAHRHAGEAPCRECVDGRNKYRSEQSRKRAESKPADAPACATPSRRRPGGQTGTYAGYKLHLKEGEAPCQPCVDARDKRKRNLEASTRSEKSKYDLVCQAPSKKYPAGTTGTFAGLRAHEFYNQEPCPECEKAGKEYYAKHAAEYYQANRTRLLEYSRAYRIENREELNAKARKYHWDNRDTILVQKRSYYEENKERFQEYREQYRVENREKFAEWNREYRRRHPERTNAHSVRRRARLKNLPAIPYTTDDITEQHGTTCYLCGQEVNLELRTGRPDSPEIDHVHPISSPESPGDVISNVRWTHSFCNRSKGPRMLSELSLPFPSVYTVYSEFKPT